jgi:hypothetical protein
VYQNGEQRLLISEWGAKIVNVNTRLCNRYELERHMLNVRKCKIRKPENRADIVCNLIEKLYIGQTKIKLASSEMKWKQGPHIMLIYHQKHEIQNFSPSFMELPGIQKIGV